MIFDRVEDFEYIKGPYIERGLLCRVATLFFAIRRPTYLSVTPLIDRNIDYRV